MDVYLYRISNKINLKEYYGMTYSKYGKTANERFNVHMDGRGGVWIAKALENDFTSADFELEVLEVSDNVKYIAEREKEEIIKNNSLYPNGYNGNCGNFIVQTSRVTEKAKKTRRSNFLKGKHKYKGKKKHAIYKTEVGNKLLSTNHEKVLSGEYKHVNYTGNPLREREEKERQRLNNNGKTDKQIISIKNASKVAKEKVITSLGWLAGREKLKARKENKDFTLKEKEHHAKLSNKIKEHWRDVNEEERKRRTSSGIKAMNSEKNHCRHCDKHISKGNYARWHGDKCKMRNENEN